MENKNMENIINDFVICPKCKNNKCNREQHPEFGESRVCESCGFMTIDKFKIGSTEIEEWEKKTAEIVRKLRYSDAELNQYWYPSTIYLKGKGAIFPVGTEKKFKWAFANIVPIAIHERLQYPIPGKDDEYYEQQLDLEHIKEYNDFKEAIKNLE